MSLNIRPYQPNDYPDIVKLYQSETYGGQFNLARDAEEKLSNQITENPNAILVAEVDGRIKGTVSMIDDGRVAWLFRFAVLDGDESLQIRKALYDKASSILKERGHSEVLVYAPPEKYFDDMYGALGFSTGGTYTCHWRQL